MATTNYAEKYSSIVDERFSLSSVTNDAVNIMVRFCFSKSLESFPKV